MYKSLRTSALLGLLALPFAAANASSDTDTVALFRHSEQSAFYLQHSYG